MKIFEVTNYITEDVEPSFPGEWKTVSKTEVSLTKEGEQLVREIINILSKIKTIIAAK